MYVNFIRSDDLNHSLNLPARPDSASQEEKLAKAGPLAYRMPKEEDFETIKVGRCCALEKRLVKITSADLKRCIRCCLFGAA